MTSHADAITGEALPSGKFVVKESVGYLDVAWVDQLLSGQLAAYRIRRFVSADERGQIVSNFWMSDARTPRYGEGADGIEGFFIGASHIEKSTSAYLNQAAYYKESLDALYEGSVDPLTRMRDRFREGGIKLRAARHCGRSAGDAKAVYWNNTGEYLLLPHDDLAQLSDPMQQGFEIQGVKHVMAANFYADMPDEGGQLKVWNVAPDHECRTRLGLEHSGFPYPVYPLRDHSHITIDLEAGDLVLLNGNLIHAVLGGTNIVVQKRLLITCFMGQLATKEVVWWT